jgi:hypothetical protein
MEKAKLSFGVMHHGQNPTEKILCFTNIVHFHGMITFMPMGENGLPCVEFDESCTLCRFVRKNLNQKVCKVWTEVQRVHRKVKWWFSRR